MSTKPYWIACLMTLVATTTAAPAAWAAPPMANAPSASSTTIEVYVDQAQVASDGAYLVNQLDPKVCALAPFSTGLMVAVTAPAVGQIAQAPIPPGGEVCFELTPDLMTNGSPTVSLGVTVGALSTALNIRPDFQGPAVPRVVSSQINFAEWGNPPNGQVKFGGEAGARWLVYLDGELIKDSTLDTIGLSNLTQGFHYLRAVTSDPTGNISSRGFGFGVGANPYAGCKPDSVTTGALRDEGVDSYTASMLACDPNHAPKLIGPEIVEKSSQETGTEISTRSLAVSDSTPTVEGTESIVMTESPGMHSLAVASGCGTYSKSSGTLGMYTFKTSVSRCWNGTKVSSASTGRSFTRTTAGSLAGYRFDSYEDPIRWYYTLNGVANAAYRYTQQVYWSYGRPWSYQCDTTHTMRVYGNGATSWAWNKDC